MRNADKIKELEYELGRYKKMVADRDKQIKELKDEWHGGMKDLSEYVDAYLIQMCLKYGYTEENGEELLPNCMALPRIDNKALMSKWKLDVYLSPNQEEVLLRAVEKADEQTA